MELSDVILGLLDWKPLTGYELKGLFFKLDFLPWSGNNNQIYTTLVGLEKQGLAEKQTIPQENLPAQKRYSITDTGRKRLREAVLSSPDAPASRNDFLLHMALAERLELNEVISLIEGYQKLIEETLAMCREKARRGGPGMERSMREEYLWRMVQKNQSMHLQTELDWLAQLRSGLANKQQGGWQ